MTKKIMETARPRSPALFASAPVLKALVRDSNDAITLQELDGTIVAWNRGAERLYGYSEAEALAMNIVAITLDADPGSPEHLRVLAAGGEAKSREVRRRTKDGRVLDIWLTTTPVRIDDAILVVTTERDVSALRRSEAIAAGILAVSADALITIDESLTIRHWNPAAEAMFGYSRAEALGAPVDRLLPERFRASHGEKIAAFARAPSKPRAMEHRVTVGLRANGQEFPISATMSKLAVDGETLMTASVRDITEARRTEDEQLLLAELGRAFAPADLDATLHGVAGVVVARLADFSTVFVEHDGGLRRTATASRDLALAGCASGVMAIPSVPQPEHPVWTAFESKSTVAQELDRALYASLALGPDQLAALQAAEPRSALYVPCVVGTACRGVLGLMSRSRVFQPRDVRLAEEIAWRCALYLENARLHHVEQQATRARDELLGVVAHDLRSPLNAIALHADLLSLRDDTGSSEVIARTVQRMTRIIGDLLDVTRLDAGRFVVERVRVPAAILVASAADSLAPQVEARELALQRDAPDSLPTVLADPQRIQQVFDNLVGNAIKFTERGTIAVGARALDGAVEFWVADTGCGIAPAHLAHVFDRFWQDRPATRAGAGLGLAIAKGIVEAHDGRMRIESEFGAGTTLFFTLPIADSA